VDSHRPLLARIIVSRRRSFEQVISMPPSLEVLERLGATIRDRNRNRPADSYTTRLFEAGLPAIRAKLSEESAELLEALQAAESPDRRQVVHEAADLLFHLLVLLESLGLELADVARELARRVGTSGLEEQRRRRR